MEAVIYRYSNDGRNLGMLPYVQATHEEDLDGTDKLDVTCEQEPSKRDRLVWRDASGTWHEHMVDSTVKKHSGSRPRTEVTCSNSISELYGVIANGTKLTGTVQSILRSLVSGTRWAAGGCDVSGAFELEVWHKNVRQCIAELCDLCGGELETVVAVGDAGVTGRTARIVSERGSDFVARQFTWGRNVTGITREVGADEVYTSCIGYGAKNDSSSTDEYADRLTVTVNSSASLADWGADGGKSHNYMVYNDSACTDASFLRTQCQRQLDVFSKPLVRYEFDIAEVDEELWSDVRLGSRVSCIDEGFEPALELRERVSHVKRQLKGKMSCTVAIGKRSNPMTEQFKAAEKVVQTTSGNSSSSYSYTPVNTSGGSSYIEGASGSSGGGDGWTHQVNGETQATGTINFVTSGSSSDSTTKRETWGGVDNAKNKSGWYKSDTAPSWGGTGGDKF